MEQLLLDPRVRHCNSEIQMETEKLLVYEVSLNT